MPAKAGAHYYPDTIGGKPYVFLVLNGISCRSTVLNFTVAKTRLEAYGYRQVIGHDGEKRLALAAVSAEPQ